MMMEKEQQSLTDESERDHPKNWQGNMTCFMIFCLLFLLLNTFPFSVSPQDMKQWNLSLMTRKISRSRQRYETDSLPEILFLENFLLFSSPLSDQTSWSRDSLEIFLPDLVQESQEKRKDTMSLKKTTGNLTSCVKRGASLEDQEIQSFLTPVVMSFSLSFLQPSFL